MELLLARHGNTFEPGVTPYRIGSGQDLPLTEAGLGQAKELASALAAGKRPIAGVFCGPLKRTREYARIITAELGLPEPSVDVRLNELSYGAWAGKTDRQIIESGGLAELEAWEQRAIIPSHWPETEKQLLAETKALSEEVSKHSKTTDTIVFVSSNGRLRYFLDLVPDEFQNRRAAGGPLKMRTGNVSLLSLSNNDYRVRFWDLPPAALVRP